MENTASGARCQGFGFENCHGRSLIKCVVQLVLAPGQQLYYYGSRVVSPSVLCLLYTFECGMVVFLYIATDVCFEL
jgi:hypothetical protein